MKEYNSAQLQELAKGVFVDDPKAPSVFVDKYGTFRTIHQIDTMSEEEKKNFSEIKNPNIEEVLSAQESETKLAVLVAENKQLKGDKEKLKDEVSDLTKKFNDATQAVADLTAQIEDLTGQLEAAKKKK